jgi:serine/threonine protein kinase, bacterial
MNSEPTEMAGVAEAETQAAYAWSLDTTPDFDYPTKRLTPQRITALSIAAALVLIAVAGVVSLKTLPTAEPSEPVVAAPAAVLNGTYQFDYNYANNTIMGSPNPPPEGEPQTETRWITFRSTCTSAGCTATSTALDDKNPFDAATPPSTRQWRFTDDQWVMVPERSRETVPACRIEEDKPVEGTETESTTTSLKLQPDGSLRGVTMATAVSSECGNEGGVWHYPFTAIRTGDVPPGVVVADPSTVSVRPASAAPVAGPVLDGTYRFDIEALNTTYSDGSPKGGGANGSRWFALRSTCTAAGCASTAAVLDNANHQEPTGTALVFLFTNGHWEDNKHPTRTSCGTAGAEHTTTLTWDLVPQPDGTLRGVMVITYKSNECGRQGLVMTTPVVATRVGPVPPNVVLADPALFA